MRNKSSAAPYWAACLMLLFLLSFPWLWWIATPLAVADTATDHQLYDDQLRNGWEDWSWDSTTDGNSNLNPHSGTHVYAVTYDAAWAGFYLHPTTTLNTAGYTHLRFWINGGILGGQRLLVKFNESDDHVYEVTAPVTIWSQVDVPLAAMGNPASITAIYWQEDSGGAQQTLYLDDIAFVSAGAPAAFLDPTPDRQLPFSKGPSGVAIAPNGRLYVASWRENRVYSWRNAATAGGAPDLILGTGNHSHDAENGCANVAPTMTNFCGPESVAVDANNNLYVGDTYFDRVQIFRDPDSKPALSKTVADLSLGDNVPLGFSAPRGVAVDGENNLWVVDEFHQRVLRFKDPLGTDTVPELVLGQLNVSDQSTTLFNTPLGVAVDSAGNVYVTDLFNDQVRRFNRPADSMSASSQSYVVNRPHDLAFDAAGNLYVSSPKADTNNVEKVLVFVDPLIDQTADYDAFTGLDNPMGLAFDVAGSLYIANCGNPYPCDNASEVLVFNAPANAPTATATATNPNQPTATPTATLTPQPDVDITLLVDPAADRKLISPDIYGIHYADDATFAAEIDLPVRRWGGNSTTRYNWQNDMYGNPDWYFENEHTATSADEFITQSRNTNTQPIITIPMTGWVARDPGQVGNSGTYQCSFDTRVYNYVPQPYPDGRSATDPDDPNRSHCGSGITGYQNGQPVYLHGNNPADTSLAVNESWATAWIAHLQQQFGTAANGGVRFYSLDNEPDIWFDTHRDVRPMAITLQNLRDDALRYAAAIKAADPDAQTLGPVVHGWTYYWHSPADGQIEAWDTRPDRKANGDIPLVPWYLQQMAAYDAQQGVRLLDYLDLHYYVAADGVTLSGAGDAATQARRLRSTRSLWDPTYVDESWIADAPVSDENGQVADSDVVRLLPRMREWVAANYPGTKLAITEYNWGALDDINGALAQADVLGIFGREGLDLAALFDDPYNDAGKFTPDGPGAYAFRIYRNYDGAGSKFGDTNVRATSSDQDQLAIYAAERTSDGAVTLVIINKSAAPLSAALTIFAATSAASGLQEWADAVERYQYSAANLSVITHLPDLTLTNGFLTADFPANSITLAVVPAAILPTEPAAKIYLPLVSR